MTNFVIWNLSPADYFRHSEPVPGEETICQGAEDQV